jgi:hypothetical protein
MSASLANNHTFDFVTAMQAGFTSALVHLEMILKITAPVDPIQTSTIMADSALKGTLNTLPKPRDFVE